MSSIVWISKWICHGCIHVCEIGEKYKVFFSKKCYSWAQKLKYALLNVKPVVLYLLLIYFWYILSFLYMKKWNERIKMHVSLEIDLEHLGLSTEQAGAWKIIFHRMDTTWIKSVLEIGSFSSARLVCCCPAVHRYFHPAGISPWVIKLMAWLSPRDLPVKLLL